MKVTVRDSEILKTIQPDQLAAYLLAHSWYEDRPFLENASIWLYKGDEAGEFEILLPIRRELGDYAARISEAIKTLEVVEKRCANASLPLTQLDILSELLTQVPNIEIQGMVTKLPQSNAKGTVTLLGVVVGKLWKINVELNEPEYSEASKAYQERLPVVCTGDLIKKGNTFVLKNPHHFVLDEALMD